MLCTCNILKKKLIFLANNLSKAIKFLCVSAIVKTEDFLVKHSIQNNDLESTQKIVKKKLAKLRHIKKCGTILSRILFHKATFMLAGKIK